MRLDIWLVVRFIIAAVTMDCSWLVCNKLDIWYVDRDIIWLVKRNDIFAVVMDCIWLVIKPLDNSYVDNEIIWLLNKATNFDGAMDAICPDNNTLAISVVVKLVI